MSVKGAVIPAGELTFKGLPPHSIIHLSDAKITGQVTITAKAFGLFEASHDFQNYTFFEYTYGSESVIRTSPDVASLAW